MKNLENYAVTQLDACSRYTTRVLRTKSLAREYNSEEPSEDPRFSDATLQVLNNNNLANFDVVFKDLFPTSLSTLNFDVTQSDNDYFTATATFKYTLYEIRNVNSSRRR